MLQPLEWLAVVQRQGDERFLDGTVQFFDRHEQMTPVEQIVSPFEYGGHQIHPVAASHRVLQLAEPLLEAVQSVVDMLEQCA
ncbi:hypothetical protein D3C84_1024550 [compost metagenome]